MNNISTEEKQKHSVMYIGSLQKGGAEHVLVNLAEYFYLAGYRVTMVTTYLARQEYPVKHGTWKIDPKGQAVLFPDGSHGCVEPEGCGKDGIHRVFSALMPEEMKGRTGNFLARCRKLRTIWKNLQPDLILSFSGKNNIMAVLTTYGMQIPVVVSVRSNPSREYSSRLMRMMALITFRHAAGVILQTNDAKNFFPKAIQKRAIILPNSLQPDFVRPVYNGVRDKIIVSVGSLDRNKNHALLLKAFAKVSTLHPDYRVVLYGEGKCREELTALAEKLDIQDLIALPGLIGDVADHIEKAGIFVLCSDQEGMPNALLEAMALGIPCIATDCPCGGPRDLIEDGINGLLTPVGDVPHMEACLERMMNHPEEARIMGQKAAMVQQKYHPDAINEQWKDFFDWIMSR